MEMKEILKDIRQRNGLTQDQLAARVMVTRQAVSRWETEGNPAQYRSPEAPVADV